MIIEKIRSLCSAAGITIAELERALSISNGAIRKWDKSKPSADSILKISEYFGLNMEYFIKSEITPLDSESLEFAKEYDKLSEKQKKLVKCYMSVV